MSLSLSWYDVALRLAMTVLAGAIIGYNRDEHGRPAGLRTTLLVCLAAAISMILANLLLGTVGKKGDSFVNIDVMRLPLGILSGMGFIGAGAIVRRKNMVVGITTAATLWFVTVIGLCLGAGQIRLGLAATALELIILQSLKRFELAIRQDRQAVILLLVSADVPSEDQLRDKLGVGGLSIESWGVDSDNSARRRKIRAEVKWRARRTDTATPRVVSELAQHPGVSRIRWIPTTHE
jgi:putative Mg2+ transporter-C (MgtC) family protein